MNSFILTKLALRSGSPPVSEDDKERIQELYQTGSTGLPTHVGKNVLSGALWGAGLTGLPVGLGTFGLGHLAVKGLPEPYRSAGYGASTLLALLLGLKAAKMGIIPGAVASGTLGAFEPSGARKELYDISKGHDEDLKGKKERQLAERALRDIKGAREL